MTDSIKKTQAWRCKCGERMWGTSRYDLAPVCPLCGLIALEKVLFGPEEQDAPSRLSILRARFQKWRRTRRTPWVRMVLHEEGDGSLRAEFKGLKVGPYRHISITLMYDDA